MKLTPESWADVMAVHAGGFRLLLFSHRLRQAPIREFVAHFNSLIVMSVLIDQGTAAPCRDKVAESSWEGVFLFVRGKLLRKTAECLGSGAWFCLGWRCVVCGWAKSSANYPAASSVPPVGGTFTLASRIGRIADFRGGGVVGMLQEAGMSFVLGP